MKQVKVSGAVILRTNPNTKMWEVFATQRGYGDFKGGWEIPGGKLEAGESPEQCIALHCIALHCILCSVVSGKLQLLEHEDAKWLTKENLRSVDWLPADQEILDEIEKLL